jgi:hypothetical protein
MLSNFHLVALTKTSARIQLFHIPLHQTLQNLLAEIWEQQLNVFVNGIEEIDFNAGYTPEEHERFRLMDYELPGGLNGETSLSVQNFDTITSHEEQIDKIKAIIAYARDGEGKELILFQNFSRSHVIQPGRFMFLQRNTYKSVTSPGLTLDSRLSAIYMPEVKKLLFHNFRITNTFLPLAEFYKEASEEDIRDILSHKLLSPENLEALVKEANQWFRKRFAMLRDSGILDNYTAEQIKDHSDQYEVDIRIDQNKIIFPEDKAAAKRLLQFLNEEIFRGAITETLYETNSKREAD